MYHSTGLSGVLFSFLFHFDRHFCVQTVQTLIRRCVLRIATSDLGLRCLPMSLLWNTRLKLGNVWLWLKWPSIELAHRPVTQLNKCQSYSSVFSFFSQVPTADFGYN